MPSESGERTDVALGREKGDRENFFISVSANIIASSVVIAAFSAMSEGESGRRRAPVWQRPNIKIGSTEKREKRRRGGRKRGKAIASGMGVRTELREGGRRGDKDTGKCGGRTPAERARERRGRWSERQQSF